MKKIRFIALFVVMLLVLSACGGGAKGDNSNAGASSVVSQTPVGITSGQYYIVVPAGTDNTLAMSVYNVMKDWEGVTVTCVDDATTNDAPEIIIGDCNRPAVAEAYAELINLGGGSGSDYIIYANGNKIVIVGYSPEAVKTAVDKFIADHLKQGTTLAGVVASYVAPKSGLSSITVNGTKLDGKYYLITPQYNMSYIVRLQINELNKALSSKAGIALKEATDATAPTFTQALIDKYAAKEWANCESAADYQEYVAEYSKLDKTKKTTEFTYEIVIGNCNRAGAPKTANKDEYIIKVAGNKIFLSGGSNASIAMAVSEFTKMVNSGDLVLTDASSVTGSYKKAVAGYNKDTYYTLTWSDDFEGSAIDESKWFVSYGRDSTIYANGLNNRVPARASKELNNNYVKDGKLYICATYDDKYYYGGHLSTKDTMRLKYGYVELSCLKPFGQGLWTALWVDNHQLDKGLGRMEIDVNEGYGLAHVSMQNVITWYNTKGLRQTLTKYNVRLTTGSAFFHWDYAYSADTRGYHLDFHTFGYGWDENECFLTVDGKETVRYAYATKAIANGDRETALKNFPDADPNNVAAAEIEISKSAFSTPAYLRLSMAVGFDSRKYVIEDGDKAWTDTNKYIVDYVHVYQLKGQQLTLY